MDKFEFLYTNSEPIAFSINSVNQYSAKSGETLEWIFPTNFEIVGFVSTFNKPLPINVLYKKVIINKINV